MALTSLVLPLLSMLGVARTHSFAARRGQNCMLKEDAQPSRVPAGVVSCSDAHAPLLPPKSLHPHPSDTKHAVLSVKHAD